MQLHPIKATGRILLIIFALFTAQACKEIDKLTHFTMDYDETMVVSSLVGINLPFNLLTPAITTNSESTFEVNETRKDLVEQIVLRKLNLTITAPSDGDFSFLKAATIYMSAEGLPEIAVASISDIPDSIGKSIDFETYNIDLREYIKKDAITLRMNTTTDKLILSDHTLQVHAEFFVDARILGL